MRSFCVPDRILFVEKQLLQLELLETCNNYTNFTS